MKAYVLHGIGDLRYEDWSLPEIYPGWALVKVLYGRISPGFLKKEHIISQQSQVMSSAGKWSGSRTKAIAIG